MECPMTLFSGEAEVHLSGSDSILRMSHVSLPLLSSF